MRYLVTGEGWLFESEEFKIISVEESLKLLNSLNIIGFDTETSKLDPHTGELLLAQFGNEDFQIAVDTTTIPFTHYKGLLEDPTKLFIIHNAKFDLQWCYKYRIVPKNIFDTFLAEKIINLGIPPGIISLTLQACCERYFSIFLDKSIRGSIKYGLNSDVVVYGCKDVEYLPPLMSKQLEIITERLQLNALDIENRFVKVLAYIEFSGIKLNVTRWKLKMAKDQERLRVATEKLNNWVVDYGNPKYLKKDRQLDLFLGEKKPECTINWSSPMQVIPLLEELGLDLSAKDKKTGKFKKSIESTVIKPQIEKSTIAPIYLEYKAANKLVTSFGQNFLDAINPVTGRIHGSFGQMKDTGRTSCGAGKSRGKGRSKDDDIAEDDSKDTKRILDDDNTATVNLQQLPKDKETRACFIPEELNMFCAADYGDQEGHIFAELTNDQEWIKFYNDPGERDGHSFTAKMVFSKELEGVEEKDVAKVRKDLRDKSKGGRFACNYYGSPPSIARGCNIPLEEAQQFHSTYFKVFFGIHNYFKLQTRAMWDRGYILISTITGLRAYIWDWEVMKRVESRIWEMGESFWTPYKAAKASKKEITDVNMQVVRKMCEKFAAGEPIEAIAIRYEYQVKKTDKVVTEYIDINRETVYMKVYKHYLKRKSSSEKQSCNYPSQGTAAAMSKIAGVNYFEYLIDNNLIFKVFIPNFIHDEYIIEAPKEIIHQETNMLVKFMEDAASIFCKKVTIKSVPEVGDHWIH